MTVNPAAIVVNDEAAAAIYKWMRGQTANGNGVALVGAIDAVATAAKVNKGAGLRPKALLIDDEVVEVTEDQVFVTPGLPDADNDGLTDPLEEFIGSNPEDARWMLSDRGQEQAASAIADAALEYLQHYDRRTRASQR